ncbi:DUF6338 family protein [Altericroceibacterium endophyticum]|uniref:Uncharacterized protein n=1 Tax=Altericroceibacterium endophyticum TaxID=1808508 RepID=A0A6I4T7K6_9SPHN|nr:DUF6338 family protein [Altericroceibacterium endophyticum]MXO66232.1 hypothetical protein [Altericroceibacterium endophyticum]
MPDLPSAEEVTNLAMLLAPGLIILGVRARFKDGNTPNLKEKFASYAVTSTAYYSIIAPLFYVNSGLLLPNWLWTIFHYFLAPSATALIIVFIDQKEWFYKIANHFGFRLAHHIPSAWDYAFSRLDSGTFIWIKLSNGTEYAGKMGEFSCASSNNSERDIYLEEVWTINEGKDPWTELFPKRGVLLCGKDIQRVEFFKG